MKGFKTSILCALLVMLMAIGCIAIVPVNAATVPTEGMSFNADDKYVMYNPLKTETLTFEAEIYLPDNGKNRSGTIVGNYFDVSGYSGNRFGVEIREYGYPQLYSEKTQNNLRSTVSLYDYCKNGEYVHLAITVERIADGKDKTHFYYNGVLVDTIEYEVPAGIFGSSCNLVVGGDHRGGNVQYYKGNIKNVALFTDVRTADEIAADAASADSEVVFAYFSIKNGGSEAHAAAMALVGVSIGSILAFFYLVGAFYLSMRGKVKPIFYVCKYRPWVKLYGISHHALRDRATKARPHVIG